MKNIGMRTIELTDSDHTLLLVNMKFLIDTFDRDIDYLECRRDECEKQSYKARYDSRISAIIKNKAGIERLLSSIEEQNSLYWESLKKSYEQSRTDEP